MTNHQRAESNAKISISLSKEMLDALDEMAEAEGRSRSNMLQRILDSKLAESRKYPEFRPPPVGKVAEKPDGQ